MRKWILLSVASLITLVIDQVTKLWVINNLELYESIQPIPSLVPLFQITRSTNTGAAFGILPMAGNMFLVLAIIIIVVMLWYFRDTPNSSRLIPIAVGMVIGGAIGNVIDRIQYGHVVDFVHYQIPNIISNVSNLADHGIVFGVFLIIGENLWREYQEKKLAKTEPTPDNPTGRSTSVETTPSD